jgi:flagellar basal-body rod modification protein FlgD
MSISAVSSAAGAQSTLNLQDFMQVLMTQLTYQDPLKPMDNQEFLAQIAQFTALGQTQQLNANIQAMLSNQAAEQSVGLIGKTVTVTTASGVQTGSVASIDLSGSAPQLTITTSAGSLSNISLSQITSVR